MSFKYLYGPVQSWRLGRSMGVDPISSKLKICNMDCVYCQLGPTTDWSNQRQEFVPTSDILNEVWSLDPQETFDCLTISGRGEPTLASNLGDIIRGIKAIREENVVVITNSSLLWREDVRRDLLKADIVDAKLDAFDEESLRAVDVPHSGVSFKNILEGMWKFRQQYKGRLSLDIMFIESNRHLAAHMAVLAKALHPDIVHINTPLRDCAVRPLSVGDIASIARAFHGQNITTVYDKESAVSVWKDLNIVHRHGRPRKDHSCANCHNCDCTNSKH